jgi:hypothetical protein
MYFENESSLVATRTVMKTLFNTLITPFVAIRTADTFCFAIK